MSRSKRLALWTGLMLAVLIAMPLPSLWKDPTWLAEVVVVESAMVSPAWLLLLPLVLLFDQMTMGRAVFFVLSGIDVSRIGLQLTLVCSLTCSVCGVLFPGGHGPLLPIDWIIGVRLEWTAAISAI